MEIFIKQLSVIIISEKLSNFLAKTTGFSGKNGKPAMGFSIPPCFIVLRNLTHPMTEQWINHERIHIRQFAESLGIFWLISQIEYLYYRFIKGDSHIVAYRKECIEQEAYLNQHDPKYLATRKFWRTAWHIRNKTMFHTDDDYNVIITVL